MAGLMIVVGGGPDGKPLNQYLSAFRLQITERKESWIMRHDSYREKGADW